MEKVMCSECEQMYSTCHEVCPYCVPSELDMNNEPLYPPTVFQWIGHECKEVPYDIYHDTMKNKHVGDRLFHQMAAPGTGHIIYEIIRMDDTGVYGKQVENTSRILTIEEVR